MEQPVTLNQLRQMPLGDVAALPVSELARLQKEVAEAMGQTKLVSDLLDGVFVRRFGDRAATIRRETGKDFGLIRFQDGDVDVAMDLPKRPSWDQGKLAGIVQTIRDSGDDPGQFVEVTLDVSERKYTAWPDNIRRVFEPARTVKAGKPSFKLTLREQEVA
ncbi:MAG: hypothetical protein HQM04_10755 [Magnetococcales bacterium]|nr:hypothetical protein [Magnetococcales bacterium]MBF0115503.1 hypothetical protein [Magnetococcales bacterium]